MIRPGNIFLFILISSALYVDSYSQNADITFQRISLEQGLSQSIVENIIQDSTGFMWFGTEDGLNVYDGYEFRVIRSDPNDTNSLSYNQITKIYEDQSGILWIGTFNGGLDRYNPQQENFIHYRHDSQNPNSLSNNIIRSIFEDSKGNLWVGTEGGLNRLNCLDSTNSKSTAFERYRHDPKDDKTLSHDIVRSIHEDREGNIWIGTDGGLDRIIHDDQTGTSFVHYKHSPDDPYSLSNDIIRTIYEDRNGVLWIGTDNGLNEIERNGRIKFISYHHRANDHNSLSHNGIYAIFEDNAGMLWIGTNGGGLVQFDRKRKTFRTLLNDPRDPKSLSYNEIRCIYEDRSGNLWIGTYGGGINKVDRAKKQFIHYRPDYNNSNSLNQKIVWCIYEDGEGILWIGTHGGGLNRFDRKKNDVTHYRFNPNDPNSLSSDFVRNIIEDRSGNLWIGTHGGGLNKFDRMTAKFISYRYDPHDTTSLSHDELRSIVEDKAGNLWIGTNGGGLNRLEPGSKAGARPTFAHYRHDPKNPKSLSNDFVRVIYEDRSGSLWIGTQGGGLDLFDPVTGSFTHHRTDPLNPKSISSDYIFSIHEDRSGILWLGTWGGGLNRFDKNSRTLTSFTTKDGLANDAIYAILEDKEGNLWLSTNNGLSKLNPRENTFINYGVEDGLQSKEFNGGSFFKSRSGEMFFGGINGFNAFYPEDIKQNSYVPPIVITRFKKLNQDVSFDQPLAKKNKINLSYKDYVFAFEFSALDYTSPERNRYAYKMEGFDRDWMFTDSKNRFATYTNLTPGSYTFRVKGSNNDGIWNDEGTMVELFISPPWWKTWWFQFLAGFAVVLSAVLWYRNRMKKINARKRELELRVKEKTEAADELQNVLTEVERLKNRLQVENIYLQHEIKLVHNFENIITSSQVFKEVLRDVEKVASTDATVLILGESGTGKELLARAIHHISERKERPLVKVDCAALPPNLIESELFGHEKGAFTGAISRKIGRFEVADGGTIFLDEIGDLPLELQTKLLRVLQDGEFERVGSLQTIRVNVRIIAATNRDIEQEVKRSNFREDLFYRLNVFPITIPPLRDRKEDVPLLVKHFIKKYSAKTNKKIEIISQNDLEKLSNYHWPGNIRELENIIERGVILSASEKLTLGDWFNRNNGKSESMKIATLDENERRHIIHVLEMTGGRVSGSKGAAEILGINPQTLFSRMKKLNIQRL